MGMADKIASLTTIGTPHLGTSFADFALGSGGKLVVSGLRPILNLEGFKDLTTDACAGFNERAKDHEAGNSVVYRPMPRSKSATLSFCRCNLPGLSSSIWKARTMVWCR